MSARPPITKKALIFWTLLGVVLISAGFAFAIFQNFKSYIGFETGASEKTQYSGAGNLAVLEIEGVIDDPRETLDGLRELEKRDDIHAVGIRISSPGGAVGPTQEIFA